MTLLSLGFDIALTFLLIATLIGGWLLSRRLDAFRASRSELTGLVSALNTAVGQAQQAIVTLKISTSDADRSLAERAAEVRTLVDELAMMTEMGDALARRLEGAAHRPVPATAAPKAQVGLGAQVAALEALAKVR